MHNWIHQHTLGHHIETNVENQDPDILSSVPGMRMSPGTVKKWYHRYQHIYMFPLFFMILFGWFFLDFYTMFTGEYFSVKMETVKKPYASMFVSKALSVLKFILIPWYVNGFIPALFSFCIFYGIMGFIFSLLFLVNHVTTDLDFFDTNPESYIEHQLKTSKNYSSGSHLWNFLTGGLNHQIEHHIFPGVSFFLYPIISPLLQKECKANELPYHTVSNLLVAVNDCVKHLEELGK